MKKRVILCVVYFLVSVLAFSQAVPLDKALENSVTYLNGKIRAKTKVAVLNFTSDWPKLSDYIIEELVGYIVNEGTLLVVDRMNLEAIRREMDFQLSGEVSDETAQSIGKKLGAQTIVSGSITAIGNAYRLRIRAISVETAQILGMQNIDVTQDSRLAALTGTTYAGSNTASAPPKAKSGGTGNAASSAPADSGWQPIGSAGVKIDKEKIDGKEKNVLTVDVNLRSNDFAGAEIKDQIIIQTLCEGSGVRFKAMGDGKAWVFAIVVKGLERPHGVDVKTQPGKIVEVDVPYSRLRQLNPKGHVTKQRTFNRNEIECLRIIRSNGIYLHETGVSTIKIFDLEIY